MSLLGFFRNRQSLSSSLQIDIPIDNSSRAYIKKIALETNINFIARSIAMTDFKVMKNKKRQLNDWHYLLNVRPNTDQSAADFWQAVVHKLIYDNEVLIILTDDNDLLIADDFYRTEYAVYPDVFSDVVVKDYVFKRTFKMDEVIYLTYNNEKLSTFLDGLFTDYGELFGRMIQTSMFANQIRSTVGLDTSVALDEKSQKELQTFIDRLFNAFKRGALAIVPKLKGFDYQEISKGENNGKSVEELAKLKRDMVDDVASILGIPSSLVHGEMSEYETAIKAYVKFCLDPLLKKIEDELNNKLFDKKEYLEGSCIKLKGIRAKEAIESADVVDKLVASGAYTRNEVREKFGDDRSDNPELDEYVITKNYERLKGGEGK